MLAAIGCPLPRRALPRSSPEAGAAAPTAPGPDRGEVRSSPTWPAAWPAEPRAPALPRGRRLPAPRAAGRRLPAPAQRVLHRLHPLPAGDRPGHAAGHLRVPDLRDAPARPGRRQRLHVRRRHRQRRGGLLGLRVKRSAQGGGAGAVHPAYRRVVHTYLPPRDEIASPAARRAHRPDGAGQGRGRPYGRGVAAPNFFGVHRRRRQAAELATRAGALLVVATSEAVSLRPAPGPGELGADVAVGELQSFGNGQLRRPGGGLLRHPRDLPAADARTALRRDRGRATAGAASSSPSPPANSTSAARTRPPTSAPTTASARWRRRCTWPSSLLRTAGLGAAQPPPAESTEDA